MERDFTYTYTYLHRHTEYTLKYILSIWSAAGHLYNKIAKQMKRRYFEFIIPKAKSKNIVQLGYL